MYSTYYGSRQDGYGYNADMLREGFDLLEARADCLGWWSVARRVLRSYGHMPVIRLRRSSDSAERDFYGIGPQGEVSTADVRAWNGWNLFARTAEFTNAAWVKGNGGLLVTATDGIAAFDGQLVASRMTPAAGTNNAFFLQDCNNLVSGDTYTFTAEFKADGCDWVQISGSTGFSTSDWQNFNVANGTTGNSNGSGTGTITAIGNGWYRVRYSLVCNLRTTGSRFLIAIHKTNVSFRIPTTDTFNGTDSILISRPQFERASSFSTYEPRTTTAAGDSFLVTLYDQSGLARHFTQSTTTLQPIICEQGVPVTENGRLAAKFVAADARRMSIASSTAMFNALHTTGGTILAVSKSNDTAATKGILNNRTATSQAGFQFGRGSAETLFEFTSRLDVAGVATTGNSTSTTFAGTASTAQSVVAILLDPDNPTAASRAFAWQNGTASATANAESGSPFVENAATNLTLGATNDGGVPHDGTISEVALFSDLIGTTDRTAWQSRSGTFYGVTIS